MKNFLWTSSASSTSSIEMVSQCAQYMDDLSLSYSVWVVELNKLPSAHANNNGEAGCCEKHLDRVLALNATVVTNRSFTNARIME